MPEQQLHLFAAPNPLCQRLGDTFFKSVPRSPGVYIMSDANNRIIYVGQSGNLRSRLSSYKNARPDRAPRKTVRLIRQVQSIHWEVCSCKVSAVVRENQLLRQHQPRFNRMNTWTGAYPFIFVKAEAEFLLLGWDYKGTEPGVNYYGAFKGSALPSLSALMRLVWDTSGTDRDYAQLPSVLLRSKPPAVFRFSVEPDSPVAHWIQQFLSGEEDALITWFRSKTPRSGFYAKFREQDLEQVETFFECGPRRLRRCSPMPGRLVAQDRLDDLLAESGAHPNH